MNDQDYIRKAVKLANEFEIHHDGKGFVRYFDKDRQDFISFYFHSDYKDELQFGSDALAAQLVRQVDALGFLDFDVDGGGVTISCPSNPEF